MKTFKDIKTAILNIPISSVLEEWEPETVNGKCCFHEDENAGSFKYKDEEGKGGIFTCFVCGITGDKIDFVMKHDGVDFKEANLRIAARFGKITEQEYKSLSKNPSSQPLTKVTIKQVQKIKEATKSATWWTNYVYDSIRSYFGLSEEHKQYLLGRGVLEEDLPNYFTFKSFNEDFFKAMMFDYGIRPKDFIGIPGFYMENKKLHGVEVRGIGIPLHNARGEISAVQLRKDKVRGKEARYIYFSSSGLEGGCSCGSPVDIVLPEIDGSVFITEGHFKAKELARSFGITSISVQGVNNTKALDEEVPVLLEKRAIRRFVIAFDADMIEKEGVKKAAIKLQQQLEEYMIPVGFMVWDEEYGKGADDVIQAGHKDKFRFVKNLPEDVKKED